MAHPGGPTLSALLLLLVAAGLHFGSATSINVSTPLNTVTSGRTTFADQTTQQNGITSPSTTSVPTSLPSHAPSVTSSLAEQATVTVFSTNTPEVKDSTVLTTNSSPQSSTGLESTEHTVAPTTSVASQTANTGHHTEVTTVTSPYINASSDISAVPTNITNISTIAVTQSPNTKTSTVTVITSKTRHPEDTTSVETPSASTFLGPTEGHTSSPVTSASKVTPPVTSTSKVTPPVTSTSKVTPETSHTADATLSSGVTVQEVPRALSSGSIAAITIAVIAVVVLVFGIAAFLKIRHSSYGRLLDDHDYGSWGNYNNPLYDDS